MANRILSPDSSLSLLVLRALKAGIRQCEIHNLYSLQTWNFEKFQKTVETYRSKGFNYSDIKKLLDAKLSPSQVNYVIKIDKIQQKTKVWENVKTESKISDLSKVSQS